VLRFLCFAIVLKVFFDEGHKRAFYAVRDETAIKQPFPPLAFQYERIPPARVFVGFLMGFHMHNEVINAKRFGFLAGSECHKVFIVYADRIERRVILFDDLAQVQAKPLEGCVTARFSLELFKANVPLGGLATMFAGYLIYSSFQRPRSKSQWMGAAGIWTISSSNGSGGL
jgi:hypothetical protein